MISSELLPSVITSPKARFSANPDVIGEFMVDELGYQPKQLPRVEVTFAGQRKGLFIDRKSNGYAKALRQDGRALMALRPTTFPPDFRVAIKVIGSESQDDTENTLIHELTHGAQFFNRPEIIQKGMAKIVGGDVVGATVGALASGLYLNYFASSPETDTTNLLLASAPNNVVGTWTLIGAIAGISIAYKGAAHEVEARQVAENFTPAGLLYRMS